MLLDWQFACALPAAIGLTWVPDFCLPILPLTPDSIIDQYRTALACRLGRFDSDYWQAQLELAWLGQLLRTGWRWLIALSDEPTGLRTMRGMARVEVLDRWDRLCESALLGLGRL